MKKTVFVLAVATAMFSSCALEIVPKVIDNSTAKGNVTIYASLKDETKTTVNGTGIFAWQTGEKISLVETNYNANGGADFTLADPATGAFTGTLTGGETPAFAISPKGILDDAIEFGGSYEYDIILPDEYTNYIPGTTNAVMIGIPNGKSGDDYKMVFDHAAALLKFTYANVPIGTKKFVFSNAAHYVTGLWDNITEIENVVLAEGATNFVEDGKSVTLNLKEEVYEANTTLDFFVPVPAATYNDFSIELQDETGTLIAGTNKTKGSLSIPLTAGDIFPCPSVTLVAAAKGDAWSHTFSGTKDDYTGINTTGIALDGLNVTSSIMPGSIESSDYARGAAFGGGGDPVITVPYLGYIENVVVTMSSNANAGDVTVTVEIGEHQLGSTETVLVGTANANTDYSFAVEDNHYRRGNVVITVENSNASKTSWIKSIIINDKSPANLSYSISSYDVLASSAFVTPVLTNPNSLSPIAYSSSDNDVASVNASTGEVTVGTKNGTTTITASFSGNSTHKAGTATYTITVAEPFLTPSGATTPAKANCANNSTVSFTVASNLDWTATKGTDINGIIKNVSQEGNTVTVTFNENTSPDDKTAEINLTPNDDTYSALAETMSVTQRGNRIEDILTYSIIAPSGVGYQPFSDKSYSGEGHSNAKYAGIVCVNSDDKIQFNASNNSGIVTTTSGGSIKKVSISWFSGSAGLVIDVYGKNTPYSSASDLYDDNAGTKIGSLIKGTNDYLDIASYYEYVGIRPSATGARYLSTVTFIWGETKEANGLEWQKGGSLATTDTGVITGGEPTLPTATLVNPHSLAITYSSSNTGVATIDPSTGTISLIAAGNTTISATTPGDATYKPGSVSYTLAVTDSRAACATPTFSPAAGAVTANTEVTISSTTTGSTIYYTTNGDTPTVGGATTTAGSSGTASATVTINAAKTIKAIAVKEPTNKPSAVAEAAYTISGGGGGSSYTITFANSANSATGITSSTGAATTIASASRTYVETQPYTVNSGNCYYGDTQSCIRIGKSGNASSLTIALSSNGQVSARSIVVNCNNTGGKNNSDATLNVNSLGAQTTTSTADDYTFTFGSSTDITSITLEGSASIRIYSITVNY